MKQICWNIIKTLLIGILFSSCKKDTTPNKAASEYFPNKVGNYWEYEVYDSARKRYYPDIQKLYGKSYYSGN